MLLNGSGTDVLYFRERVLRFALIQMSFMLPKTTVSPLSFFIIGRYSPGMLGLTVIEPLLSCDFHGARQSIFAQYLTFLCTQEGDCTVCSRWILLLTAASTIFVHENWFNYVNSCFFLLCAATQLVHLYFLVYFHKTFTRVLAHCLWSFYSEWKWALLVC